MPFTESINTVEVLITEKEILNATPNDVAENKVYVGTTRKLEVGTVPVNPKRTDVQLKNGESFNIPRGINPAEYNISVPSLDTFTTGDAISDDIIEGKSAWVKGTKITGAMPDIGHVERKINAGETSMIEYGRHDGTGRIVAESLDVQTPALMYPYQLIKGCSCWANGKFVEGTMPFNDPVSKTLNAGEEFIIPEGYHDGTGKINANILSGQTYGNAHGGVIVEGYNAWVNGERVDGTMPSNPQKDINLPVNGEYVIPLGYHTGFGKVVQNIPSKPAMSIAPTKENQTIEVGGFFMEGDITINGIDALSYQRPITAVKDLTGVEISNYPLNVVTNKASVSINVDNWHDNNTLNVYQIISTDLIDAAGNTIDLDTIIMIDFISAETRIYKIGNGVTISISLATGTNAHVIEIAGITSGHITIKESFAARELGIENK